MTVAHARSLGIHALAVQQRKLRRLVADTIANVPFYRERYGTLGLTQADLADPQLWRRLPVLTKADLLAAPLEERRNRRLSPSALAVESSTGSTGQPFSIYVDAAYRRTRNLRFLRALAAAGYRPWRPLMLLTDRLPAGGRRIGRRYYVSIERPTAEVLDTYRRIRPAALYGLTTPLRLLAERLLAEARAGGAHAPAAQVVISTAEVLDPGTRQLLETAFRCPVVDFYGMTEAGLVAWQRPGRPGYIFSPASTLTELVPMADGTGQHRILVTNLDLHAAPIIRYDAGDIATVCDVAGTRVVEAFEGRRIDTIVCRNGAELSPYRVTAALQDVPGLRRFRVTQHSLTEFRIELEAAPSAREAATHAVRAIFERLLGGGLTLELELRDELIPQGTRKFRPVESLVARPPGSPGMRAQGTADAGTATEHAGGA